MFGVEPPWAVKEMEADLPARRRHNAAAVVGDRSASDK